MFGIGPGELMVVLVILLIAVGPNRMPQLMQALGKGIREFRRAANELRHQVGIDDLVNDEQWRDPLGLRSPAGARPGRTAGGAASRDGSLSVADRRREYPPEGVDVRHAAEQLNGQAEGGAGPDPDPAAVPRPKPEDAA